MADSVHAREILARIGHAASTLAHMDECTVDATLTRGVKFCTHDQIEDSAVWRSRVRSTSTSSTLKVAP